MFKLTLKILVILLVIAVAAQQIGLYYAIVFEGSYIYVAPVLNIIMVVAVWPIVFFIVMYFGIRGAFNLINGEY